jgi:hypothetical protein
MLLAHQTLLKCKGGCRRNLVGVRFMCANHHIYFKYLVGARKCSVHGHMPSHLGEQPKCGCLVIFVIIMRTHPTHYYLESSGTTTDMGTHP